MQKRVILYSSVALEPWDWTNPWTKGIGGSETSHIELAERLGKAYPFDVTSYAPIADDIHCKDVGPSHVPWRNFKTYDAFEKDARPAINLIYRDPTFFDKDLRQDSKYYFIAQDVDYAWTPERLAKVHRYICLCQEHVNMTVAKYPELKGRVYLSTNGVRSQYLHDLENTKSIDLEVYQTTVSALKRNPHRLFYASSPDRGLLLILQNWFRIREAVPDAELHVAYGMNNMETILSRSGGQAWFSPMKSEIEALLNQEGVTWLGRINQHEVYKEFFQAGVWFYPTDWPETSCIASMEAQACGAIPVTNAYWAMKQNILHGVLVDGIPQHDPLTRVIMIRECIDLMRDTERQEAIRPQMMQDARDNFDWQRIVDKQLVPWIEEDFAAMGAL